MKLKEKLQAIEVPKFKTTKRKGEELFASGIKNERALIGHLTSAKESLVGASLDFYEARFAFEHGEWETHCSLYSDEKLGKGKGISIRTIQRRLVDAEVIIRYVMHKHPEIEVLTMKEIRARALKMELPSTREMVQTMRDCGVAIEFGQYYPEDYERKKRDLLLGQGEFDFAAAEKTLALICNPKTSLPSNLDQAEELAGTLKSAAIRAQRHVDTLKKQEPK